MSLTQGCWEVRQNDNLRRPLSICAEGRTVADVLWDEHMDNDDEPEGNASLIAAAPDLLTACRAFLSADPGEGYSPLEEAAIDLMRAAIAKAEGRA